MLVQGKECDLEGEDTETLTGGLSSADEIRLKLLGDKTTADTPNANNGIWSRHSTHLEEVSPFKNVDEVYQSLGQPGRYTVVLFCLLTLNNFTISPNHVIGIFLGYSPPHECHSFHHHHNNTTAFYRHHESRAHQANISNHDATTSSGYNTTDPPEHNNVTHFRCKAVLKVGGQGDEVRHCERGQWTYDVAGGESSSVTEWDLVCDRAYLANLANTFYYIGVMVGGILFGYVSDVFGRKVALLLSLSSTIGVGVAIVLTRHLVAFFALRTVMGVAIQGFQTATNIYLVEMFTPRHRSIYVTIYSAFWSLAVVCLSLAAWAIRDWRWIQMAAIGQACIAGLYLWIVPESLRWLITQGKEKKASHLVRRISRFNNLEPDPRYTNNGPLLVSDSSTTKKSERASYLDLVRSPTLRRRTIFMNGVMFAANMGYWGITYNTTALIGNKYLNFTLGSVAETIMSFVNVFIISRFGKKKALVSYFSCGGVCCIVMCFLLTETSEPYVAIIMVTSTLGRLTTAGMFVANNLYMAELFPTVVRNMGAGVCTFTGRLGAVFTPLIFTAGLYTFKQFPLLLFGMVMIAGAALALLLPETGKLNLPDTLDDVIIVDAPNTSNSDTTKAVKLVSFELVGKEERVGAGKNLA